MLEFKPKISGRIVGKQCNITLSINSFLGNAIKQLALTAIMLGAPMGLGVVEIVAVGHREGMAVVLSIRGHSQDDLTVKVI